MVTGTGLPRLLAAEFEPSVQRREYDGGLPQGAYGSDGVATFAGTLRLSSLLAETIVVTDNQVLDGCLFLRCGPRGLHRLIGRSDPDGSHLTLPIEVRTRQDSLADALATFLEPQRDDPPDRLRWYEFFCLDRDDRGRIELADRIATVKLDDLRRRVRRHGPVAALTGLLVDECGVSRAEADWLRTAWQAWIDAAGRGEFPVVRIGGPANLARAFAVDREDALGRDLKGDAGRKALGEVKDRALKGATRSQIRQYLYEALPLGVPDADHDRAVIDSWFTACVSRANAFQHDAEHIEFVLGRREEWPSRERIFRRGERPAQGISRTVKLPEDMLRELGTMPRPVFETARYQARGALRSWWSGGGAKHLRRVTYCLLQSVDQPDPDGLWKRTAAKLFLIALTATLAQLFTGVYWAVKVLVLAAALAATRADDLLRMARLRRDRLGAVIDLRSD
jgi:hypothetical protein